MSELHTLLRKPFQERVTAMGVEDDVRATMPKDCPIVAGGFEEHDHAGQIVYMVSSMTGATNEQVCKKCFRDCDARQAEYEVP